MDYLILAFLAPVSIVAAYGSLLPYAKKEIITDDLRKHWVSYALIPMLLGCLVIEAGTMISVMVLLLALGAMIDRNIAYAPDGIVIPLLLMSCLLSPLLSQYDWWMRLLVAGAFYGVADLCWTVQVRLKRQFITPADILSLLMPYLFFGLTFPYLLFNPLLAIAILTLKKMPHLHSWVSAPEAVDDAVQDTAMAEGSSALTLLTVSYPIFLMLIIFSQSTLAARPMG